MTAVAIRPRITPDDLLRMPDRKGFELVDGQLVEKSVSESANRIAGNILALLFFEARRTGEARLYPEMGYRCFGTGNDVRFPDVSLVRQEKRTSLQGDVGYFPFPPDLAVEVVSPNDLASEVALKLEQYLAADFPLVWIVQPETQTIQIHRADGTVTKLHANDTITGESALPGFQARVADLFS